MPSQSQQHLIDILNQSAESIPKTSNPFSSLLEKIGNSRFVLIGEASHGTKEFYQARAEITQQLIEHKGFMAVAIEGDWPDVYKIHRYLQDHGDAKDENEALENFERFPIWMWRNKSLLPFLHWVRNFNAQQSSAKTKVGFYGLDLYSLFSSMQAVINYLKTIDPEACERARNRYACFDHIKADPQTYGYLASMGVKKPCIKESVEQLVEMQNHAFEYIEKDGLTVEDEYFYALQNARLVKNAENYYRSMYEGRVSSWNIRDQHMFETLQVLADHLENRFAKPAKIIVWAHNSHVGDARATEMEEKGEVNIGQLVREQHQLDTYLIGFSTYDGTVTAASNWDYPAECKRVNPGLIGSYEHLFHQLKYKEFFLHLRNNKELEHYLRIPRLQRAIGVIYRPDTERDSHYFFSRLAYQFDSLIHLDRTSAVEPLQINSEWQEIDLSNANDFSFN